MTIPGKKTECSLPEIYYTPRSQIRHPLQLAGKIWQDFLASRELAWRLMVRDISAMYRQSFLGMLWAFLPPLMAAIALTMGRKAGLINIAEPDMPYPAYVMFSMALWQTFVEALRSAVQTVGQAKSLLVKVNFPREAIVLANVGKLFFNLAIKLVLIIAVFIWFQIPVSWMVIFAPIALLHLIAFGTTLGLFLAPLAALYQDVSRAITFVVSGWMFLTPVIYPLPGTGLFGTLVRVNPVTPLLLTVRELCTTGVVSNPAGFILVSSLSLIGLLTALMFYRLALPFVIERMGV
jgi:lipopolysaccharide transport system permease protein